MNQPNYIKTCSRMLALVTAASIAMSTGVVAERSNVAKAPQPVEENSSVVMQADVSTSSSEENLSSSEENRETIEEESLEEEAKGITATFDYNEDAPEGVVAPDAITAKDGKITLPMPKEMKKGEKEFICWKKLNNKEGYIEGSWQPGDAVTLTEDTTFVGKWRKPAWAVRLTFKDEQGNIIKDDATLATFKASLIGDNGVVIKSSDYAISSLLIYDEDSDKYIPRGEYHLNIDLSGSQYSFVSATLDNRYYDQKKHEMITEHTAFNPASEKMTIPRPGVKTEIDTNFLVTVVVKKNSSVKATFKYDKNAPQGFTAPAAISAKDGKVTLPLPKEIVSGDTQFIGWKDADTKAIVQPGMEVSLEQSKTYIGVWKKAYWSVNLTLKDSSNQNITEKAYPSITSVTLKDKQGREMPGVYDKEKNVISFYKAPETEKATALFAADATSTSPTTENGYLLRGTYELQLNFKDGTYQTVSATLNGEKFNLTSGTIAVPEDKIGVTADDTQELVIMLSQAKQSSDSSSDSSSSAASSDDASSDSSTQGGNHSTPKDHSDTSKASSSEKTPSRSEASNKTGDASQSQASKDFETTHEQEPIEQPTASDTSEPTVPNEEEHPTESETEQVQEEDAMNKSSLSKGQKAPAPINLNQKGLSPKTGDITLLSFAGTAVLAAGAFVASKRKQR